MFDLRHKLWIIILGQKVHQVKIRSLLLLDKQLLQGLVLVIFIVGVCLPQNLSKIILNLSLIVVHSDSSDLPSSTLQ